MGLREVEHGYKRRCGLIRSPGQRRPGYRKSKRPSVQQLWLIRSRCPFLGYSAGETMAPSRVGEKELTMEDTPESVGRVMRLVIDAVNECNLHCVH
jgi:hypothetical protein